MPPKLWASSEDEDNGAETTIELDFDQVKDMPSPSENPNRSQFEHSQPQDQGVISPRAKRTRRFKSEHDALPVAKKPSIQAQQHANLFYLSLIEDRCKIQAAKFLNAQRSNKDLLSDNHPEVLELARRMFRDLLKTGIITQESAVKESDLNPYLRSFDGLLHNIAATKANQDVSHSIGATGAMVKRLGDHHDFDPTTYSLRNLTSAKAYPQSLYGQQYEETALLGSGGEGSVYKARYMVDNAEYAIKKVMLKQLQRKSASWTEKLKEVHALARLNHPNVVRYHHSWIEFHKAGSHNAKDGSFSSSSSSSQIEWNKSDNKSQSKVHTIATSEKGSVADDEESELASEEETSSLAPASYSEADESLSHDIEEIRLGFSQQDLSAELDQIQDKKESYDEDIVVFGHSSNAKPKIEDEDEDEPDYETKGQNKRQWFDGSAEVDAVLYIKMTAYHSNLHALLSNSNKNHMIPQHCFHILPTIRILITIIDGLQYIHRRGIIHQDIKPGNIFLSVLEAGEPPTPAYVNITDCPDCVATGPIKPLYICPHIGDFGMIKDIKSGLLNPTDQPPSTDSAEDTSNHFLGSNLSAYKAGDSFLAGTGFYKPPQIRGVKPLICPKRDCYALGAVALEMICRFGTKTERVHVFSQIRDHGVFPREVTESNLGECIMGMLRSDRDERWALDRVKGFLVDLEKRLCDKAMRTRWDMGSGRWEMRKSL